MQRDSRNVGGGGKTAQKPTSSAAPKIQLMLVAKWVFSIRMRTYGLNVSIVQLAKRGRTDTIATSVRVDQRHPRELRETGRASEKKARSHLYCHVYVCTVSK
jgi:hypothetical protein